MSVSLSALSKAQSAIGLLILLVVVKFPPVVHQVLMTIHALLFIAGPGIHDRPVRQHGAPIVGNIKKIAMAFLALDVFKRRIGGPAVLVMIIFILNKMDKNIFDAVPGLGIKEIKRVVRCRQMTVHAVGHKSLGVIDMTGGLPSIVGKLNFMAGGTKLGGCGPHHRIVGQAEKRKTDHDADGDKDSRNDHLFHAGFPRCCILLN